MHKHAKLMAEYAQDALTNDKPWELWEYYSTSRNEWRNTCGNPLWDRFLEYRRKPKKQQKILVNGVELNAPETERLGPNTRYYVPDITEADLCLNFKWGGHQYDYHLLKNGLIYLNQQDAIKRAEACLKYTPAEEKQEPIYRYFANKGGFKDSSAYVKVDQNDQSTVIKKSGEIRCDKYCLERCLNYIETGLWEELNPKMMENVPKGFVFWGRGPLTYMAKCSGEEEDIAAYADEENIENKWSVNNWGNSPENFYALRKDSKVHKKNI